MDRTIPPTSNIEQPKGVDTLACACHNSTQQPDQYHHRTLPQPNPLRIQPHAKLRQSTTNPQCPGQISNTSNEQKPCRRHPSAQQSRQPEGTTPGTVSSPRTGLARCISSETSPSEGQTHPKTLRPIQDHPGNIAGGLLT